MSEKIYKWLPVIDAEMCNGCMECVLACSHKCIEVKDDLAILTNPDNCCSQERCVAPCLVSAIHMEWVRYKGDQSKGKWK